ncbi:urease accessory protein UreE [Dongia sp.]|uniref:urease accessory protein UreE n=1 Tax=Dongia sp. TaxID=1977262 RepID=UPI0035AFA04A
MNERLPRATAVIPAGYWPQAQTAGCVTLTYAERCRRRIRLVDDGGQPFLLDLDKPVRLADGDGLQLMGNGFIRVVAAQQKLLEARAKNPQHLARLAWHVGNRHTAAQVTEGLTLRLIDDAVLRLMLQGLGAELSTIEAPFHPEGGAYAGSDAAHGHAHGSDAHTH